LAGCVFIESLAPSFVKSDENPSGVDQATIDTIRQAIVDDRPAWRLWSMQSGLMNAYASIKAFSETDFTEDLKKIDVPTLVLHGEDDQIVPVKDSAHKSAKLIVDATGSTIPARRTA
jgi:non-heme chloroperoxidase